MQTKSLQLKRALRAALLFLLLSAAGMAKAASMAFAPIGDTIKAKTVGIIPYSDDFITQEEVMERYYAITSFRMIDTTTVAVLTGASDMILVYSFEENQILRKIQLPIFARAFEYDNGLFHVIGDRTYLTIDAEGLIHERKNFQQPQLPNDEVFIITDLKIIDGQPVIHECNANTYSITSDGLQEIDTFYYHHARGCKIRPQYIDENSFTLYNDTPSRSGRIRVSMESLGLEGKLACLDEISVNDDFIAINLQTSHNPTGRFVKSYLLVVNSNGELINLVEVPIDFLSYIHKPFSYKDNAWYYAFSGQEGISIFKINTNTNSVASPDSYELYDEEIDYSYYEPENETSGEDTNSPTRGNWRTITQAWENAERFRDMEWTPVSGNVSAACTPITSSLYITTPVSNYNTQIGVPYKYGGFTDWDYYKDLASSGKYTGNRHCYYGHNNCNHNPYQNQSDTYVIGVDCSGFLSRCWELSSKLGTTDIPSSTYTQSLGAVTSHFNDGTLRTGDALNQLGNSNCTNVPRHVMMYAYHSSSSAIIVFESSSDGWKVNSNSRALSYFQGQYYCLFSSGSSTYYYRNYTIQRSNIMKNIILRLNSAITMRQNGSIVTTVTQGQPLTVTYSVKNFGSEVWEGDVYLYIEQSDGDLMSIKSDHTTLVPGDWQSFTFSNNGVISPVGTTKFYVKVKNYSAGGYDRPYDVGNGEYSNPLEFEIVEGGGGGGSCKTCPDYDEYWLIGNEDWYYKSSSISSGGCRIYEVPLYSNYTYTFKTCGEGSASFDTRLYLYNSSCNEVANDDDGCTGNLSSLEYTIGNTGYYYLKIDGYGGAGGSFTIAGKRESVAAPCSDCPDYDETWNILSDGEWQTRSSSIVTNGCRIYRVAMLPNYTYTFQTCGQGSASFDTRLYLFNPSCTQVAYNDDSNACSGNLSSIEYTNTGNAGYYYLKIDGYGGAGGSFTIAGKRESPIINYVIDASANPSAGGTVAGAGTYQNGSTCTLTATPNTGYTFSRWTKNGSQVSTSANYSFTVTENASYVANFNQNSYTISASASPSNGGSVSGTGTYNHGNNCTLTATPSTGYTFTNWTKNGQQVSTSASYSFTVTESATYVANFSQNSCTVSASANPSNGGTVSGGGTYNYGANCTLTATPNPGYTFTNWTKNGQQVSTSASYSFTVTGSGTYVANFTSEGYYWDVNIYQYPNTMSVIGVIQIDGVEQTNTVFELGAFVNDECRGRERLEYESDIDRYLLYLTLFGNDDDQLTFKLYDHSVNAEVDKTCLTTLAFETNGVVGTFDEPFVFDFGDALMQSTSFNQGWTWWSTYIEQSGIDGLAMLEEELGTNGLTIKSQSQFVNYNPSTNRWSGSLKSINNEGTFMIRVSTVCEVAMAGAPANPADHPITLYPGWTWIGYPVGATMSMTDAFANITSSVGDQVKSQGSFATYTGTKWSGSLKNMEPGKGYMYKSNSSGNVTLVYPEATAKGDLEANITAENNHWVPNVHAHPTNMTMMAVVELDEVELAGEHYELAAFANGECRGSAHLMEVDGRHIAFLTIAGEEATELYFGLYDAETGESIMDAEERLDYEANATLGELDAPFVVHFRGNTGLDEAFSSLHVYPNPVNRGELLSFSLTEAGTMTVEIVNALGVVVETVYAPTTQTIKAPRVAGVYTLRISVEGKGTQIRKLVVK